jgi:hypothetical protein
MRLKKLVRAMCVFMLGTCCLRAGRGAEGRLPEPAANRITQNRIRHMAVDGDLKKRMDAIIDWEVKGRTERGLNDRWLLNDLEHTLPPRGCEEWTGDVWGAYIETMSVLARLTGKRYPEVDRLVRDVLKQQRPDGSFWNVAPEEKELATVVYDNRAWGWQRALIGLAEYHRTFPEEKEALRAATRLGDFLLKLYEQSRTLAPYSNMARVLRGSRVYPPSPYWGAVTQGLCRLYQITHDKRYLDAATEIADRMSGEVRDGESTTEYLTWHGAMLLYEETGKADYFDKVQKNVRAAMRMMTALGDTPALWAWPKTSEGCGLADSITVNCDLWRATLDPAYMDVVERILYNGYFASIYPRTGCGGCPPFPYGPRVSIPRHADPWEETGIHDCFAAVPQVGGNYCCNWHIPLAFRDMAEQIYAKGEQPDVYVNLFIPSGAEFSLGPPGGRIDVRLAQETDYPHGETVLIRVEAKSPVRFPLHIRIPYWCEGATVALNSGDATPVAAGRYVRLDRQWSRDAIRLRLPMRLRIEAADPPWGRTIEASREAVPRAVVLKGPAVLVLDRKDNANMAPLWDEAHLVGIRPLLIVPAHKDRGTRFDLPRDRSGQTDEKRPFTYPASHYAGIWELPGDPGGAGGPLRVKGHLTPFAEVTGHAEPSHVQFVFPVRAVDTDPYAQQYGPLLADSRFEMTDQYGSFLKSVQATKTWVPRLTECIRKDMHSYDAVLAAQRLGRSGDAAALKPLTECLKTDNFLRQRTALGAIQELGKADGETMAAVEKLAREVPELRGEARGALAKHGRAMAPKNDHDTILSWIDGPASVPEYVAKKTLKIARQDVQKADIRICSWDFYEVWLNGKLAGVKPTVTNIEFADLTSLLKPGENELLLRVIRRERLPERFTKIWSLGRHSVPPGIIAKLRIQYGDGREEAIYTDGSWTAAALPATTGGRDWLNRAGGGLSWGPCRGGPCVEDYPFYYW